MYITVFNKNNRLWERYSQDNLKKRIELFSRIFFVAQIITKRQSGNNYRITHFLTGIFVTIKSRVI